jgi:hypothetical protein
MYTHRHSIGTHSIGTPVQHHHHHHHYHHPSSIRALGHLFDIHSIATGPKNQSVIFTKQRTAFHWAIAFGDPAKTEIERERERERESTRGTQAQGKREKGTQRRETVREE